MVCITTLAVIQIKSCCTNPSDTNWSGFHSAKSATEKNRELQERKTDHGVKEHRTFTDYKFAWLFWFSSVFTVYSFILIVFL